MPTTAETITAFRTFLHLAPADELLTAAEACNEEAHQERLNWIRRRDAGGKGVKADLEACSRRERVADGMSTLIRAALHSRGLPGWRPAAERKAA